MSSSFTFTQVPTELQNPTFKVPIGSTFGLTPKQAWRGSPAIMPGKFTRRTASTPSAAAISPSRSPAAMGCVACFAATTTGLLPQLAVFSLPSGGYRLIVKARFDNRRSRQLCISQQGQRDPAGCNQHPTATAPIRRRPDFWSVDEVPLAITVKPEFNGDRRVEGVAVVIGQDHRKLTILLGAGNRITPPVAVDLNPNIPDASRGRPVFRRRRWRRHRRRHDHQPRRPGCAVPQW